MRVIRAVLSGSYHGDTAGLQDAYDELATCGVQVLSPHRLEFEDTSVLFVRDKAEKTMGASELERHHLSAIDQADFLWVHLADGHLGTSTAFEVGYALAKKTAIFTNASITEPGLSGFIHTVPSVYQAIKQLRLDN